MPGSCSEGEKKKGIYKHSLVHSDILIPSTHYILLTKYDTLRLPIDGSHLQ